MSDICAMRFRDFYFTRSKQIETERPTVRTCWASATKLTILLLVAPFLLFSYCVINQFFSMNTFKKEKARRGGEGRKTILTCSLVSDIRPTEEKAREREEKNATNCTALVSTNNCSA